MPTVREACVCLRYDRSTFCFSHQVSDFPATVIITHGCRVYVCVTNGENNAGKIGVCVCVCFVEFKFPCQAMIAPDLCGIYGKSNAERAGRRFHTVVGRNYTYCFNNVYACVSVRLLPSYCNHSSNENQPESSTLRKHIQSGHHMISIASQLIQIQSTHSPIANRP